MTPEPLKGHRCMLFLLVSVVSEDRCQRRVARGVNPLVVPVDCLELFLD